MSSYGQGERPGFVSFLGILMLIGGGISVIMSLSSIGTLMEYGYAALGIFTLIRSFLIIAVGAGLLGGRNWARIMYVILALIGVITTIASPGYGSSTKAIGLVIGVPIGVAIIGYLYGYRCSRFFDSGSRPVSEIWQCTECGVKNPGISTVCGSCKTPKPSGYTPMYPGPVLQSDSQESGDGKTESSETEAEV